MSSVKAKTLPVYDGSGDRALFVDDLTSIEEFGPVTHLLFSVCRNEVSGKERHRVVVQRMIIPTALRAAMGRQLLACECTADVAPIEGAQLH
jgi:hypothetical protein